MHSSKIYLIDSPKEWKNCLFGLLLIDRMKVEVEKAMMVRPMITINTLISEITCRTVLIK